MQQVLLVLHNKESRMTGTRNNRDIEVTINTFAAHTIAGPFALSPKGKQQCGQCDYPANAKGPRES
jgi:hypothetical protein